MADFSPLFDIPLFDSDKGASYAQRFISTYGASVVYRLTDIKLGETTIYANTASMNGTLTAWGLESINSPVAGDFGKAPFLNGTSSYGDVLTAPLISAFNGKIGSVFLWGRAYNAGVWTDGTQRRLFTLVATSGNDLISIFKNSANGTLTWQYVAGGTTVAISKASLSTTDWFSAGLSYRDSASGNSMQAYYQGTPEGAPQAVGAAFTANPLTLATIGSRNTTPTLVWHGYEAFVAFRFGSIWSDAQFAAMHAGAG